MTYAEFSDASSQNDFIQPDSSLVVADVENVCVVNDWFPMPLAAVSSEYARQEVHTVLDGSQSLLGEIITCQGEEYRFSQFSAPYLAAYLADVSVGAYAQPGRFARDYFVCLAPRLLEYRQGYLSSSAVWGGFDHYDAARAATLAPSRRGPITINAVAGLVLPTDMHMEAATRSVVQPHAFERFLKLYHLLELSFDYRVVQQIRSLGNDLQGVGQILTSYDRGEPERLRDVLSACNDPAQISACLRVLCSDPRWHSQIGVIFFDYGKSSNPLAKKRDAFESMLVSSGFTEGEAISFKLIDGSKDSVRQATNFEAFTLNVAAYWIYRVRCCIAHNRIGEYVMRLTDEPFVEEFAETLLRSLLRTVLH
jgi:hypothetical protein